MGLSLLSLGSGWAKCGRVFVPAGSEPGNERLVSETSGRERFERGTHRHLGSSRISPQTQAARRAGACAFAGVAAL